MALILLNMSLLSGLAYVVVTVYRQESAIARVRRVERRLHLCLPKHY